VEWIIKNQFDRRNLSPYQRTLLALKLEESIKARAKAKQSETLKKGDCPVKQNSAEREPIETREEIAKLAGVSRDTVDSADLLSHPLRFEGIPPA
jgi:hypothetical protein